MNKPIIMFDLDGTLLDLAFDDLIWNHKLPERHAKTHQISLEQSNQILFKFYQDHKHTLDWYSTRFWTAKVGVDTFQLQHDHKEFIKPRQGCIALLSSLKQAGYRIWLVTNADERGLALKMNQVDLTSYFEVMISSETIGFAKERFEFWDQLQKMHPFEPRHCVLVDDTAVVLEGAKSFGIEHLITITQPSSAQPERERSKLQYPAINDLRSLIPYLDQINHEKEMNVKTA